MASTVQYIRTNPGVMAMTLLLVGGTLVFGLLAFIMARSGASLPPIVFIAAFFAIVVGPQAPFHLNQALGWIPQQHLPRVGGP